MGQTVEGLVAVPLVSCGFLAGGQGFGGSWDSWKCWKSGKAGLMGSWFSFRLHSRCLGLPLSWIHGIRVPFWAELAGSRTPLRLSSWA